jgi:pilus assembly protein CpaB
MKHKIIILVAVVCGIIAMFLVRVYIGGEKARLSRQYQMVRVMAAIQDLPMGTPLARTHLVTREVQKGISERCILPDRADEILGRKLLTFIPKGSPITWSDITGDEKRGGNLAMKVKPEERALSIPVDLTSSVTGHVEPNDHVDILGTFSFPSTKGDPELDMVTLTILQNVTILATGKEVVGAGESLASGNTKRAGGYSTVTILVTPKEAEMLVFAMQKGRLTLTLRNPEDVSTAKDIGNVNFNYLEKKVGDFNEERRKRTSSTISEKASSVTP